ncbi:peptidylprolyl isomerase [Celeribacter sp.]|uniref:peptidylprolyl isomerase n=1 Tax=Celeribacter sp. TaxID=1890673 RepID=UPI003A8D26C3
MFLRKSLFAATVATAFALTSGVQAQDTDAEAMPAATAETVVATVNGQDITLGAVIAARRTLPAEYQQLEAEVLFRGIVDRLVQQEALSQKVDEPNTALKYQMENDQRALLAGEALMAGVEETVTEEDIQAAYDEAFADFEPSREYRAAHILVETEDEALALITELEEGADFADLAREKSTGPSGPNGGDLGWFGKGMMVAPFEEAVVAMEPGTVSEPVQTQFGWHVIKLVESRLQEVPALDEVREQIEDQVRNAATEEVVNDVMSASEVTLVETIDVTSVFDDALLDN